jgi:voltage-gated potassium channel
VRSRLRRSPAAPQALVALPARRWSPVRQLAARVLLALMLVAAIVVIVYVDRNAYTDSHDGEVTLVDAIYYATVTITTTGYGDITPVASHARVLNAVIITPLRITFLVLLVGTTLEVLANQGRQVFQDHRWRRRLGDHTVVIGYGTAGRSAVRALIRADREAAEIVVIDPRVEAVADANLHGYAAIRGDGTRREILRQAELSRARQVIITMDRDDSAILAVLTARQLNPTAHVTVAAREEVNASLMRPAGADAVILSSEAVGRLLGLSTVNPNLGTAIQELLSTRQGLDLHERAITADEAGVPLAQVDGPVVAVVRDNNLRRFYDPAVSTLHSGDRLVVVQAADSTNR